jgi:hypothetical protein
LRSPLIAVNSAMSSGPTVRESAALSPTPGMPPGQTGVVTGGAYHRRATPDPAWPKSGVVPGYFFLPFLDLLSFLLFLLFFAMRSR